MDLVALRSWDHFNLYLATEDPSAEEKLRTSLLKLTSKNQKTFNIFLDATVNFNLNNGLRPEQLNFKTHRDRNNFSI